MELSFVVSQIGRNIDVLGARRAAHLVQRLLGHQPEGLPGTFSAARERLAAHVEPHSVWLRNSVRGAVGLGIAVLVANLTGFSTRSGSCSARCPCCARTR